ncbi:sec-independent protein translocase protein TATA, chloroplastic-like [Magnolia sinica]|uniref:sec-independent protein translocase protein TATA, chloroplastic-like n=1 Tax=Magnolia sinica TaxID=86752 RepID=UPI00265A4013|nr:sec-independent protein translocase protein TATA, chloroplastic-like [Magnolia sinica]
MAISASSSLFIHSSIPRAYSSQSSVSSSKSIFFNDGRRGFLNHKKNHAIVLSRCRRAQKGLSIRCLFGLGVPELVVIAGVAALVFGPKNLPDVGRSIGKTIKSFQQAAKEFETELKKEPEDTAESPVGIPAATSEDEKQEVEVSGKKES